MQLDGSGAASLTFERATFAYAERVVVRDVDLRVAAGEMVGLLGPNGAGKSTLLRLASGVLRPQAGRVLLGSSDLRRLARAEVARRVAVVPQEFSVQFAYTVRQLVELGRMPHMGRWGLLGAGDRAAVAAALEATDLGELADRVFNELSGGERQRVLVAMALAQGSGLLLLDEPTAHLDIRHQVEVLELLVRLNGERGCTVIAVLHDLNLAARYFSRLILFQGGVVADGPPAAVLDAHLLGAVYEVPVQVGILRGEEFLSVLPPGRASDRAYHAEESTARAAFAQVEAHVVAGGGTGELAMRALADAGIAFTAGALNVGDSDYALATRLAIACIGEPPFAPVSPEGVAATKERMLAARLVAICPVHIGPGNVALLEAAVEAARAGRRVLLLEPELGAPGDARSQLLARMRERDFTHGRALAAYANLLDLGARIVQSPAALVDLVRDEQAG